MIKQITSLQVSGSGKGQMPAAKTSSVFGAAEAPPVDFKDI